MGLGLVLTQGVWMPVGKVKWYDGRKGYGFVLDGSGQDVFVHYTVIEGEGYRCLRDGEEVEYDVTQSPKGLLATRVRRLRFGPSKGPQTGGSPDSGDGQPRDGDGQP
jgi:cold shock protein